MSENDPVALEGIPVFTGNLALLDTQVTALTKSGATISTTAGDVHSSFGGLQAFYRAPEAEQLFATTKPIADTGLSLKSDLSTIANALSTYSDDAYPLVEKLKELKRDAGAFLVKANADDKWREDGDLVEENNNRHNEIAETWAAFQTVERACHAKIVALVGGTPLKTDDGSGKEGTYGYDAEALKHAKGLPWGDPVEESKPWWHLGEHLWDFTKGVFVDGVWGTIKGLGTLFGTDGWDAAKQAWSGLQDLTTGVILTIAAPGLLWATPEDRLPGFARDSRRAMKETGKALLAWDQWGENPSRAAGAVTFNVLTTVFTGGAGGGVSGVGKAAVAAKALSFAGKAGRIIDPMTYVFKGAGAGLTKISDVMAGLKGSGAVEIPKIDEGAFSLPEGSLTRPDGTIQLPKDTPVPAGATELVDGAIKLPEGTVTLPPNTVKWPFDDGPAKYADIEGNLYKEDGTLFQRADKAKVEKAPDTALDTEQPKVEVPVRQEAPVLAGVGARGGDDAVRLGSEISDPVRTGDNGVHVTGGFDNTPGGRGGDHSEPRGHVGGNLPRNDVTDTPRGGPSRPSDTPLATGPRPDAPGPGARHTDGPAPGSHGSEGSGSGGGRGADDAVIPGARSDDAMGTSTHNSDQELTPERRKELQQRHVELANADKAWRLERYNKLGRRRRIVNLEDGVELPQLTLDANGKWIAIHDLPTGPRETRLSPTSLGTSSVPDGVLPELNKVSGDRRVSVDLNNAELKLKEEGTSARLDAVKLARAAYDTRLPGVPNNSKISEALGNRAAVLHVIPHEFPPAKVIDLPKTPNGANMFDGAYELPNNERLIVEEKAPSNDPDWRQGKADPDPHNLSDHGGAQGMRVQQGTKPYIRTILAEMTSRGGKEAEIAADLRAALKAGKLRYVLVKAKEDINGLYAGAVIEQFKI
ncbi:hypothetical protein OG413_17605 [Streptomyces sp. NBC_01433]|uniref:hypothetical protein n=1 Tax=Streptomyces sp. NBC_01433 TaxID=2903864 RepID=UPI00224F570F|nr:hypothetical protein [Streptomyces sp. NBC_01433]MCX4677094.1 hypothetical protein [Streptomyces sp. NBC_01433]